MKRRVFLLILTGVLFSLICASCSHQTEQVSVVDETALIKYAVNQARKHVDWTAPIEPDAVSGTPAGQLENGTFFPNAGFTIISNQPSVFPVLEDFTSLDTSDMSDALLSGVNDFLSQLSEKKLTFSSSFFEKKYEGVVILYEASNLDAITGWKIGKPYIGTGDTASYEIPVLLLMNDKKCIIRIYLNPERAASDAVAVQQIMFGAVKSGE